MLNTNLGLLQSRIDSIQYWNIVAFSLPFASILLYLFDAVINYVNAKSPKGKMNLKA